MGGVLQRGNNMMRVIVTSIFLLSVSAQAFAASQLAPLFDALANDTGDPTTASTAFVRQSAELVDKLQASEELPAIIAALNDGNPVMRSAAVGVTLAILGSHAHDAVQNANLLKPPLPELHEQYRVLLPIVSAHFNDFPDPFGTSNWKEGVVGFVDEVGGTPTPEMVTWMLSLREFMDVHVTPILAHMNPMPPDVYVKLMSEIENNSRMPGVEVRAMRAIQSMAENKSMAQNDDFIGRLVAKALDKKASQFVRTPAILALSEMRPSALLELKELALDADEEVAWTATAVGLGADGVLSGKAREAQKALEGQKTTKH